MAEQAVNDFSTQLNGAVNGSTTTIVVDTAAPAGLHGGEFRVRIDDELLLVTAGQNGTSWTVQRGAEGTTAASHVDNAEVVHVLTDASFGLLVQQTIDADARMTDARTPTDGSVTATKVAGSLKPSGSAAAGDEALRALGTGATQAAAGNDSRFPTAGQKNALAGTAGTPGTGNEYATKQTTDALDGRLDTLEAVDNATQTELDAHSADTTSVHGIVDTSALSTDAEVAAAVAAHVDDATGAHAASAIAFTPAGSIAADNVQDAIEEVASEATGGGSNVQDGTVDGQIPVWDDTAGVYEPAAIDTVVNLDDLTDVSAATPAEGDMLYFDGVAWIVVAGTKADGKVAVIQADGSVAWEDLPAGGSLALDDITDVDSATPTEGDMLYHDGTNWVEVTGTRDDGDVPTVQADGSIAWEAPAGGGGSAVYPRRHMISPYGPPLSHVRFNAFFLASTQLHGFMLDTDGAADAEVVFEVPPLDPGSYTIWTIHRAMTDGGIATVALGDEDGAGFSDVGTIDSYAAATANNQIGTITGVAIAASERKTIRLKVSTRNAGNTTAIGNAFHFRVSEIGLRRTGA